METTKIKKWISQQTIKEHSNNIDLNNFKGFTCSLGLDVANCTWLNSISILIHKDDKYYFKTKIYLPIESLVIYPTYKDNKEIILTDGNVSNYDYLVEEIENINNILPIDNIYYDCWTGTKLIFILKDKGYNMQSFSQSLKSFDKPTRQFFQLINSGSIIIDKNKTVNQSFKNTTLMTDYNDNIKPCKVNNIISISPIASMLTVFGGYLNKE